MKADPAIADPAGADSPERPSEAPEEAPVTLSPPASPSNPPSKATLITFPVAIIKVDDGDDDEFGGGGRLGNVEMSPWDDWILMV